MWHILVSIKVKIAVGNDKYGYGEHKDKFHDNDDIDEDDEDKGKHTSSIHKRMGAMGEEDRKVVKKFERGKASKHAFEDDKEVIDNDIWGKLIKNDENFSK